jgi:hypothetical protein
MVSLQNILSSEGQEFLDNLLNKEVVVNEKLNAATLSFQKKVTSETDLNRKLTFYKGSGVNKREITVADRVMTNFYSSGMSYLSNLSKIIIDKIPNNWTFVCKYFPNHQPSFINYSVLPKNNLVLSCIITSGGTKIEDVEDLRSWAEMFDIAYQEPVFRGYLTQYQKERLNDYLKSGSTKDSFARFVITLLNPNLTHSLFQNDGFDSPIDGFIFKFISDDGITKPVSAKLIDPYMTNIILKNKSNKGFKDNTDVLLSDFAVFMTGQDLDSILLHSDDESQRYLELFYRLFNRYIKYKKSQLEDFDVDTNDIVKESINVDFDVDMDQITNETTKKLLKENPEYKSIFKTLLGSFKSKKPEDYKSLVMSPGVVRIFNGIVDKINDKIKTKDQNDNLSFTSYLNSIHHKVTNVDIDDVQKSLNSYHVEEEPVKKSSQVLSFADFKKKDEKEEDEKKEKKTLKSIEDMIKDLQKDVNKIKDDVKDTQDKVEDTEEKVEKSEDKEEKKKEDKKEPEKKEKDTKEEEESKEEDTESNDEESNDKESEGDDEKKDEKENDNPLAQL